MIGTCEPSRFDLNRPFRFDSIRKSWADSKIFESVVPAQCPLLVIVKPLKLLMVLSGTASSMSDHTPVLFNVFEHWNEESVIPHIFFYSICMHANGQFL